MATPAAEGQHRYGGAAHRLPRRRGHRLDLPVKFTLDGEIDMLNIIIHGKPYGQFSLSVLPVTDVSFVELRILVFDCEGLFKSFDNTVFGHPPTVSKRGISVQSGANWES